jgi:hypothetical protein
MSQKKENTQKGRKTLIAMPTTGFVVPAVVNDLIALTTKSREWSLFHTVDNCVIQDARNQAVLRCLESGCDGVVFIDSDQTFPADALDKLKSCNKDIVGYPIVRKAPPYHPNISKWNEETQEYEVYANYPQHNLFKVDYIGMGFTYIRREVFEKMTMPYFDFSWHVNEKYKMGDKMIGEDVYFCRKAKELGFNVWANPMTEIGHIGNFEYLPRLHFNYEKVRKGLEDGSCGS